MRDLHIPDLTFPMVKFGRMETPWDLRVLLYRGGAIANSRTVFNQIASGEFGKPIIERIGLVLGLHATMTTSLVGGGSKWTAFIRYKCLRNLFAWADLHGHALTLECIEATYRHWTHHLQHRVRIKSLSETTAHSLAGIVSTVLSDVLDRHLPLIETTQIRSPKKRLRTVGVAADKQNIANTFEFGHLLFDILDGISTEAVWGPLPLRIVLRSGTVLEEWSHLRAAEKLVMLKPGYENSYGARQVSAKRTAFENDRTLRTRYPLVNLRIGAELLVFIAQTGMNLSQAHQLEVENFSYKSTIDGYAVRYYKARRQGEVLFEIFAEYKPVFERYLAWRNSIFCNDSTKLLFPLVRAMGRASSTAPQFNRIADICEKVGIPFVPPKKLRMTRVNWLLRQSRNPDQTAEQAQHTKQTLLRIYEQPSLQITQIEIIQFWKQHDPTLTGNPQPCPAPGVCDGIPKAMPNLPLEAPTPDCTHPAGCLFCGHHRDIDSEDYVWSVASMKHLNVVILAGFQAPASGKADSARHVKLSIEVLAAKMKWYRESNTVRRGWIEEALERVEEGNFHPHWRYVIESAERV